MSEWELQEAEIQCPYCWEAITVLLNPEDEGQEYIEDCQVCCRPIEFYLASDGMGGMMPVVSSDSD